MSQPDLTSARPSGVIVRKPKLDVYTVLLVISLLAISIGCLLLWLEIGEYRRQIKGPTAASTLFQKGLSKDAQPTAWPLAC